MTTTIDAMKELQQIMVAVLRDPQNITRKMLDEMTRLIDAVIAHEEAQTVERLPDVLDTIRINRSEYGNKLRAYKKEGYAEGWLACMSAWADHMTRMNNATKEMK